MTDSRDSEILAAVDDPRQFVRLVGGMVDELETDLQFYDLQYTDAAAGESIRIVLTRRSDVVDRLFESSITTVPAVSMQWLAGSTAIALRSGSVGVDEFAPDWGVLERDVESIHAAVQAARDQLTATNSGGPQ